MELPRFFYPSILSFLLVSVFSIAQVAENGKLNRRIFLVGDAGYAPAEGTTEALKHLTSRWASATESDLLLFLGDNIYPKGLPQKEDPSYELASHRLAVQAEAAEGFPGTVIFMPGNHDWYAGGLKGLKRQEKFLKDVGNGRIQFLPENQCMLQEIEVDDTFHLVVFDSQHYLEDWDEHPGINEDCDLKTRKKVILELESIFKKQEGKTVLLAIHHPLYSYGPHGGYFPPEKHLFPFQKKIPLPVVGTAIAAVRKTGGISPQDLQHAKYREMIRDIETLIKESPARVVVASGHEHNLQYLEGEFVKQIVSGAASKTAPVGRLPQSRFTYSNQGYAVLSLYESGASEVTFFGTTSEEPLFSTNIYEPVPEYQPVTYSLPKSPVVKSSVYPESQTRSSGFKNFFWGEHYRDLYGREVSVPVVTLDTLYGGLKAVRKGGGHQTKTLRLADSAGNEYNLRGLKKSGVRFLQTVALKDKLLTSEELQGTLPEKLLTDFYTASHPYAAFAVGKLATAAGIYHPQPILFYLPKQETLEAYNRDYGNELYMLEARPDDGHRKRPEFGKSDKLVSTDKLFEELRKDEKHIFHEDAYIRARLFDILIGDWDRHGDQWRWALHEKNKDSLLYSPIPRDRDQAFSHFDGFLLDALRTLMSPVRMFQPYEEKVKHLRWFNTEPLPLDRNLIQNAGEKAWEAQATFLQQALTDEVIEIAFNNLPEEVQDESAERVKKVLTYRRDHLTETARRYYKIVSKLGILRGTDKDEFIELNLEEADRVTATIWRNKGGEKAEVLAERTFYKKETEEIWVYGLGDDDDFKVIGKGRSPIRVRLIGGLGEDTYDTEDIRNLKIYEHKDRPNSFEDAASFQIVKTNQYETLNYDFDKNENYALSLAPFLGFNPDAGFIAGAAFSYTHKGFEQDPFTYRHRLAANYHFATEGVELDYEGNFKLPGKSWMAVIGAHFNSPTFTRNFFGFGNDSENPQDELGLDFNRVNMSAVQVRAGLQQARSYGGNFYGMATLDGYEIEPQGDRFITTFSDAPDFLDWKYFASVKLGFSYQNYDFPANPVLGLRTQLEGGYTYSVSGRENGFFHLRPGIEIFHPLTRSRKLVLRANAQAELLFAKEFEFYQSAFLGGNTGLRGYRIMRFAGEKSFVFGGDLRYNFNSFKTAILPVQPGIYVGYDRGRVWFDGEDSNTWHDNFGGGFYLVTGQLVTLDLSLFNSPEGNRFVFGFRADF